MTRLTYCRLLFILTPRKRRVKWFVSCSRRRCDEHWWMKLGWSEIAGGICREYAHLVRWSEAALLLIKRPEGVEAMLGFVVFSLFFFFSPLCLSCTLSSFFFRGEQLQPAGKKSCKDAVGDQNVSRGCCAFSRRLLSEVARQWFLSFLPFFFFFPLSS